jgi:hypothetical protein
MLKKYLIYVAILPILIVMISGCEDDLLTQVNPNTITDASFWKTQEDFEKGVNAMYGALQLASVSGNFMANEAKRSDLAGTESWYNNDFTQLKWNDATPYVASRWSELYVGVFRANQLLKYTPDATDLSDVEKELIIGQAKFIRGYCYFWLANGYNGAVVHSEYPNADQMDKPFSSKDDVINNRVIPDLTDARDVLPKVWDSKNVGRITWGAATAMLGKTYLFQKDWENAEKYFGEVIYEAENNNLYALVPNFMDNFTVDNEYNSESVLEIAYSDNFKPGNSQAYDEINGSEAAGVSTELASLYAGGYNTVLPTYYTQELFVVESEFMDPNHSWTSGHVRSMRTYATLLVENGDGDYYNAPLNASVADGGKANFNFGQGSKVKKFTQWDRVDQEDTALGGRTGINYRAIRYADVLLMYAEALLELGNVSEGIKYIDQVRARAGVKTLQGFMDDNGGLIPRLDVSKYVNSMSDYDYVVANKENVLRHLRMVERVLEFAFEGHRWYDLVRWGIVKDVFSKRWEEEKKLRVLLIGDATKISPIDPATNPKHYPLFLNERVRPDFEVPNNVYNPAVHDYFPIPSVEKQNNKEIE